MSLPGPVGLQPPEESRTHEHMFSTSHRTTTHSPEGYIHGAVRGHTFPRACQHVYNDRLSYRFKHNKSRNCLTADTCRRSQPSERVTLPSGAWNQTVSKLLRFQSFCQVSLGRGTRGTTRTLQPYKGVHILDVLLYGFKKKKDFPFSDTGQAHRDQRYRHG